MSKEENLKYIIQRYLEDKTKPGELKTVFSLFENPFIKNPRLRALLFNFWNQQDGEGEDFPRADDFSDILDKIHHRINLDDDASRNNKKSSLITDFLKIAAILLIGIFAGYFIYQFTSAEQIYYTSIAPHGSISEMILPDSSIVFLNSGSEIRYAINTKNSQREVILTGEACFDVSKNKKRPFVVHTPYYDVRVLGTKFNVKAYESDNKIVTTLEEGNVEILMNGNVRLQEKTILKPGEQLIYDLNAKKIEIKNVNTGIYTSWKDNKLIFVNMNLKELIVILERKFGVDIKVADDMVLDYHYDGILKNETIIEVLELLKETLPIQYKIDGQKVIIQKSKEGKSMN